MWPQSNQRGIESKDFSQRKDAGTKPQSNQRGIERIRRLPWLS